MEIKLVPKKRRVAKYLSELTLCLRLPDYLPARISYVEANGDKTDLEFSDIEMNLRLDPLAFRFDPPEGTEIVETNLEDQVF